MKPKAKVHNSAVSTTRLLRSANKSVPEKMPRRIKLPPKVGVPFFFWCDSGVSSRTFDWPCWAVRSISMSRGPSTMPRPERRHAGGDDAKGRVAQEVEVPRRTRGQASATRRAGTACQWRLQTSRPASASTTRSSRMPRLALTSTTSPGRSRGLSQPISATGSSKCAAASRSCTWARSKATTDRGPKKAARVARAPAASPNARWAAVSSSPSSSMSPSTATA